MATLTTKITQPDGAVTSTVEHGAPELATELLWSGWLGTWPDWNGKPAATDIIRASKSFEWDGFEEGTGHLRTALEQIALWRIVEGG